MIHPDILQAVREHYKTTPPEIIRERLKQSENSPFAQDVNLLVEFANSMGTPAPTKHENLSKFSYSPDEPSLV